MSEEDQTIDVVALPKFDMPSYESSMSAKDIKSLALCHGIPLDLHHVALTNGWTMDQLPDDMIGMYEQRAIPGAMAWRHHDSDISDSVLENGFSEQYIQTLAERVIDLRPVPSGLLFQGGLATTWDFLGFRPVFKDTEGNVATMSEYLRFPFLSGATIEKGSALTNQDQRAQHIVPSLPVGQAIPDKTGHKKKVEVEDPKIVATRERKACAADKKREKKKQGGDGGEGSLHNYFDAHREEETNSLRLGSSSDQSGRALTNVNTEVIEPSPTHQHAHRNPTVERMATPLRTAP
nr:hypothetical protein [Tanacetum cinerariifolium]